MKKIRILVADDTAIAREGMRRVVQRAPDMDVVGEAETPQRAVEQSKQLQPDLVLLDLKWFGDDNAGASAIPQIIRVAPHSKVIAITAYDHLIEGARQAGAAAAITKDITTQQLHQIIRDVYTSPPIPAPTPAPIEEPLTKREKEVLELLADGLTDRQIAGQLCIAESTAKNHVRSILGKLDVSNRTQAAIEAIERGLLKGRK